MSDYEWRRRNEVPQYEPLAAPKGYWERLLTSRRTALITIAFVILAMLAVFSFVGYLWRSHLPYIYEKQGHSYLGFPEIEANELQNALNENFDDAPGKRLQPQWGWKLFEGTAYEFVAIFSDWQGVSPDCRRLDTQDYYFDCDTVVVAHVKWFVPIEVSLEINKSAGTIKYNGRFYAYYERFVQGRNGPLKQMFINLGNGRFFILQGPESQVNDELLIEIWGGQQI